MRPTAIDRTWQLALRSAFPALRLWWHIRRAPHRGALVALWLDGRVLLVRSSYKRGWSFPGGGVDAGETAAEAAIREVREEVGLAVEVDAPSAIVQGSWDGRPETVHFFDVALAAAPTLRLDHREITAARFVHPDALPSYTLTGPVAAYFQQRRRTVAG